MDAERARREGEFVLTEVEVTSGDLVARALERITAYEADLHAFTDVAAGPTVPDGHGRSSRPAHRCQRMSST